MKNIFFGSVVAAFACLLPIPAQAAFIGDIVGTTGDLTNVTGFNGPAVLADDALTEFSGELEIYDDVLDITKTLTVDFDFFEDIIYVAFTFNDGEFSVENFTVDFTEIDWVAPYSGHTIIGAEVVSDDSGLGGTDVGISTLSNSLTIEFTSFELLYSRYIEIEILHEPGTLTPSVVPVPAAAPMALLGLGVLTLARRLRRKTR